MGTLVLAGATSGSTTLTPVDAVTTVITLPSATGTLATLGANTFTGNQSITGTLAVTGAITSGLKLSTFNTIDQFAIVANTTWSGANQRVLVGIQKSGVGSGGLGINASDNVTLFDSAGSGQLTATSTGVTISGTLGVTGTITPGQTTGIVGTTTNNNVQAGSVGEFVSSSPTTYTVTASASNMTSISLTAGDWDVSAQAGSAGISAGVLSMRLCISSASAAFTSFNGGVFGQGDLAFAVDGTNGIGSAAIPPIRLSLASTTTVYLVIIRYGGTNFSASGIISARRVR